MIDDRDRIHGADDSDELWDDDLSIAAGPEHDDDPGHPDDVADPGDVAYPGDEVDHDDEVDPDDSGYEEPAADDDGPDFYDHTGPEVPAPRGKSLRKSLSRMRMRVRVRRVDDNDSDDFFDNDAADEPEPEPRPKPVKLDPEDPDYWMDEESQFERIIPKPRKIWKWWLGGIMAVLALTVWLWIWFFHPYVEGAVKYGYIKSMERRGTVVKTFEGVLIPYRELGDTTPTYFEPVPFSVDGDSLAARMKAMMLECIPVRLEYEVYHTALPWKGAETLIVTKADSADVSKILPPEYR